MKNTFLYFMLFTLIFSCQNTGEITSSMALSMVEDEVESNPIFETGKFDTDKMKLTSSKDQTILNKLQELEDDGYIEILDEKKRKKWFSKDSAIIITPSLSQKALPYVVKQSKNFTLVKTIVYKVDESQDVTFDRKTENVATFNVVLTKEKTPFYEFGKDSNPNSEFVTKKFKAKYKEETGWILVK